MHHILSYRIRYRVDLHCDVKRKVPPRSQQLRPRSALAATASKSLARGQDRQMPIVMWCGSSLHDFEVDWSGLKRFAFFGNDLIITNNNGTIILVDSPMFVFKQKYPQIFVKPSGWNCLRSRDSCTSNESWLPHRPAGDVCRACTGGCTGRVTLFLV